MSLPGPRTAYDWRAFAIAGIPVTFSAWYLLVVWLCLARAGSIELGFVHLIAVTISVLVHELGHGLVAKGYGLRPTILLHGFGGWCEHATAHRRDHALRIAAAGPAAGLTLGASAWVLGRVAREAPWWLDVLLWDLAWMGLFWSMVNLLPILPLDGGAILENLLERRRSIAFPKRLTRRIGVVAAVLGLAVAISMRQISGVLLLALLAWDNAAALGWVAPIPGMSAVQPVGRVAFGRPRRPWWRPTPAVALLVAALGVPVLARGFFDVEDALIGALALTSDSGGQPWRLLTYPLVPAGRPLTLISALLALWLTAPALERRRGARALPLLLFTATLAAGLAGAIAGAFDPGGVLAGPVAPVLAFVAAWAWLTRDGALGPNAVLPVRPPIVLLAVVLFDLLDRYSAGDTVGAASDLAAVATGLLFVRLQGSPQPLWRRLELWWKLRNPPPIRLVPPPR